MPSREHLIFVISPTSNWHIYNQNSHDSFEGSFTPLRTGGELTGYLGEQVVVFAQYYQDL